MRNSTIKITLAGNFYYKRFNVDFSEDLTKKKRVVFNIFNAKITRVVRLI